MKTTRAAAALLSATLLLPALAAGPAGAAPIGPTDSAATDARAAVESSERRVAQARAAGETLGELARRNGLRFGTAVNMTTLADDPTYAKWVATEFTAVTAENVMKWESLEPERGVYNWGPADDLVAEARRNKQLVHGHTLLWHNQNPVWLTDGLASGEIDAEELRALLKKHVFDTVRHFKGKVPQWDVANEIVDDEANLRDTIWLQHLGPGYIADVLRWAHEADPKAKLFINDYNVEGISPKTDKYLEIFTELKAQGVPLHGFGIQGHLDIQYGAYPAEDVAANMKRFTDLGLDVAITEADVRMDLPADNIKLLAQSNSFNTLLQGCLLTKRCVMFTVWGVTDKYSWVPDTFEGQGAALLLDENYATKPAYHALHATLKVAAGRR